MAFVLVGLASALTGGIGDAMACSWRRRWGTGGAGDSNHETRRSWQQAAAEGLIRIEKQALAAGEGVVRRGGVGGNDDGKVDDGDGCMEAEE